MAKTTNDFSHISLLLMNNESFSKDDPVEKEHQGIPVYDGIEPYYLFRRKWEIYLQSQRNRSMHGDILKFLNLLFDKEYINLVNIKKISPENIPSPKKFTEIMSENPDLDTKFGIRHDNSSIPTAKLIDTLLNRINFSFVETGVGKKLTYSVKTYRYIPE